MTSGCVAQAVDGFWHGSVRGQMSGVSLVCCP